jgi:TetR/AcrR family transcriptional regulator, cholesterol catabolism regulator
MSDNPTDSSTRDRILDAASAIARGGARVTVRGVAARAGVGMGTLRYHFATQRELLDAVLSALYEEALPDERIRDATVPAQDRLLECLGHLLSPVGVDDGARRTWTELFHAFIDLDASTPTRSGYVELHRQTMRRIESWLSILVEEGVLARGDNSGRARFLLAVVNGLAIQRAFPSEVPPLDVERAVLREALAAMPLSTSPSTAERRGPVSG